MNLTQLKIDCQNQARKCFDAFKNDVLNYPLKEEMTKTDLIAFGIDNSIENGFRGGWMNTYMSSNLSKLQLKLYCDTIDYYKSLTCTVARNWGRKCLENKKPNQIK